MPKDILVIWQSLVVENYRSAFYELNKIYSGKLGLVSPHQAQELGGQTIACESLNFQNTNSRFSFKILKVWFLHIQIIIFFSLIRFFREFFKNTPKHNRVVICFSEPYAITTLMVWLQARLALGRHFEFVPFSLQNIYKEFSFPLKQIQKFIFARSRTLLVCGDEQRDILRKQGFKGAIEKFNFWYDSRIFKDKQVSLSQKYVIGFSGAIKKEKGVFDFLQAIKQLPMDPQLYKVLFAGGGPAFEELRIEVENMQSLGFDIQLLGPLALNRMPDFYSQLDLLVVPSRTRSNWKEQFGRIIVEAMACGCVVIGSNSGEIPNVIVNKDRIFREGDIADFSEKILKNLQSIPIENRRPIRDQEIKRAQVNFSDHAIAQRFKDIISEI